VSFSGVGVYAAASGGSSSHRSGASGLRYRGHSRCHETWASVDGSHRPKAPKAPLLTLTAATLTKCIVPNAFGGRTCRRSRMRGGARVSPRRARGPGGGPAPPQRRTLGRRSDSIVERQVAGRAKDDPPVASSQKAPGLAGPIAERDTDAAGPPAARLNPGDQANSGYRHGGKGRQGAA
jgi:hypothetical protein